MPTDGTTPRKRLLQREMLADVRLPYGLTPIIIVDPRGGTAAEIIDEIVLILERLVSAWRS